ncbi:dihydroorotase family protein [Nguyenibacter vanlangensis]|uniref:Dihydroorotase family protein n=1 Tax=Nguyenibacter vanlangensis TaxID=1216886 RepID=A0ABZ3DAT4_9PROT
MKIDFVLKGTVVTESAVIGDGWVAVADERIVQIGQGTSPACDNLVDYGDALLLPGGIDAQVHSRTQAGQEDFVWTTRAAAAGGVTTIMDMPYDDGFLVCNADRLMQKANEAAAQVRTDFGLWGTIDPRVGAGDIAGMVQAGAVGFKFSTFETHPERFPRIPSALLAECFAEIAQYGLAAGVHNEDDEYVKSAIADVKKKGLSDWSAHGLSRPALAEALAITQIYEIGVATGCSAHVVHASIPRGYELCAAYRQQGADTTIEACIHYLLLDEEGDVARLAGKAKVNPPIRPRRDVEGLWHHLAAGNVTIVSTDHVSWSLDRKLNDDMLANASGVPSLEVIYPLFLTELGRRGLSLSWGPRLLACNPSRLFRISGQKGALRPGLDADITVMKRERWTYDAQASTNAFADWSPYDGREIDWKVAATYLRGRMVYDGDTVMAQPGSGRRVRPWTGRIPQ